MSFLFLFGFAILNISEISSDKLTSTKYSDYIAGIHEIKRKYHQNYGSFLSEKSVKIADIDVRTQSYSTVFEDYILKKR